MTQKEFTINITFLDTWIDKDKNWNYIQYVLCIIFDKMFLLERKL